MKLKIQLGRKTSDIFVILYLIATLWLRFVLEAQLSGHLLISMAIGAFALLFLWALYKSEFIQPSWFGLIKTNKT